MCNVYGFHHTSKAILCTSFEPMAIGNLMIFFTPYWCSIIVQVLFSSFSFVPLHYIKRYKTACCMPSMAPTALNNHVLILLKDYIWLIQEIKHRYCWQLCWSTTRLWHLWRTHQVHQRLNNCMICGIHVSIQWEVTFPTAVKSIIPIWCDDPVLQ